MAKAICFLAALCCSCIFLHQTKANSRTKAYKLFEYVSSEENGYYSQVRPVGEGGEDTPVVVNITAFIIDFELDADKHVPELVTHLYFRAGWRDPRLKYDVLHGLETPLPEVKLSGETPDIWTPDVFSPNLEGIAINSFLKENSYVRIKPSGKVHQSVFFQITSSCQVPQRDEPKHILTCPLQFESYAHHANELVLQWGKGELESVKVQEGIALSADYTFFKVNATSSPVQLDDVTYSRLSLNLRFQRV